jgi:hypothetical protein
MSKQPTPGSENTVSGPGGARTVSELPKAKAVRPSAAEETVAYQAAPAAAAKTVSAAKPAPAAPPVGLREELEELQQQGAFWHFLRGLIKSSPAWLTSMLLHFVVLLVLALLLVPMPPAQIISDLVANTLDEAEVIEELPTDEIKDVELENATPDMTQQVYTETVSETLEVANNLDTAAAAVQMDLSEVSDIHALKTDLLKTVGATGGSDLSGRGNPAARQRMIAEGGGNAASENAVAMALAWLAKQQLPDGGWDFGSPGSGGTLRNARNGATGMALLPFLGAGQTQKEGKYKQNVYGGLAYLMQHEKPNGSLIDSGNMYSHGIASICLAEAYAMTQERQLHAPAQAALNFIMSAQDKVGGGWRYTPGQAGDTSAVGWQLMALKSGHMGYMAINPQTIKGAEHFLNTVQSDGGAKYGYLTPGAGKATTAVGLLCRMYLGWKKDNAALERGVQFLSKTGPDKGNMYFNYYATQVLHHWGGDLWKQWNEEMRDYLVNTQEKNGANKGSWQFNGGDHGSDRGGRLYCTAMACMTLEVYYRHLPIYRKQASEMEFEGP